MTNHGSLQGLRVRLDLEQYEDRLTPAGVGMNPYRVLVQAPVELPNESVIQQIRQVRGTVGAESLGLGLYRVQLGPGLTIEGAKLQLARLPVVQTIQPDYKIQLANVPNDPRFVDQWGLQNTGRSNGSVGSDINAQRAWTVTTGTRNTIVAVIDTGVDYRHPDLAGNMWVNPREVAGNNRDDDGNGFVDDIHGVDFMNNTGNPMDDYRHGTHVAGIIGAVGNNGQGVTGVNWNTRIMALRFMSATGGGFTSDAVRAINYAVANGAKVINNSWGGAPYDSALVTALTNARNAGVIVVNAAGNTGNNTDQSPFYPGSYSPQLDNVITVAATSNRDQLLSYSNFGANTVTLAAPGENILSTMPNNGYGYLSGTSMATPFVSGAISLLWDARPNWSYRQVIDKLMASIDPLPSLAGKTVTGGRINLAKLLDAPAVAPVPPVVPPPAVPPVVVSPPPASSATNSPRVVNASFSGPRDGAFDRIRLTFSRPINVNSLSSALSVSGPTGTINVSAVLPVAGSNNTQFNLMFSRMQVASGTYQLVLAPSVTDTAGNRLDQNGNGIGGEVNDRFVLSTTLGTGATPTPAPPPVVSPPVTSAPVPSPSRVEYGMLGGSRAIQDRRTTRVDFNVTEDIRVADLTVSLDISHGRTSDLNIRLVAPDGRIIVLFNRRGGSGSHLSATVFDDGASTSLAQASAPFRGAVRPEQSLGSLAGMSAKGLWSFQLFDLAAGFQGTLNSLSLSFGVQGNAGVSTQAAVNLAPEVDDALNKGRPDRLTF